MYEINISLILAVLESICADDSQKATDRITSAKLLLDYSERLIPKNDGTLTVAFENIPGEFCS